MFKLTIKEIIELHNKIIKKYGGELGLLNEGNLAFMVDQINYEDKDIFWKSALILKCIVCGHPFVDGNKRTALEIMETYLYMYGYEVVAEVEEKVDFVLALAKDDWEMEAIIEWLKRHTRKL